MPCLWHTHIKNEFISLLARTQKEKRMKSKNEIQLFDD